MPFSEVADPRFGLLGIQPGPVSTHPAGVPSGVGFGTLLISATTVTAPPDGLVNYQDFSPFLARIGATAVMLQGLASEARFGPPILAQTVPPVSLTGVANLIQLIRPTLQAGQRASALSGHANTSAFGSPVLLAQDTVSVTAGSKIVTGVRTSFMARGVKAGWQIALWPHLDTLHPVQSVDSDIQLTLAIPYQGATVSGGAYQLRPGLLMITLGPVPWYRAGTVSVTQGSPVVTGSQTAWLAEVSPGDAFLLGGLLYLYEIVSVDSDTQLTLYDPIASATASGQSYAVQRLFSNATLAGLAYRPGVSDVAARR